MKSCATEFVGALNAVVPGLIAWEQDIPIMCIRV